MIPSPYEFALLALAAFRVFRLLGYDTILDRPRERFVRRAKHEIPGQYRKELDIFFHCPWCLGAWLTLGWWGLWLAWPHATVVAAVPWALSAVVGLVTKNLDP